MTTIGSNKGRQSDAGLLASLQLGNGRTSLHTNESKPKKVAIKHFRTGHTLFEGHFNDMKHAVETAISDGVSLAFADLRHANLINAQMDGAILDGAQLDEANLLGANLSESSLRQASLRNALLHSVTFCESVLDNVNAQGALFGATDIAGATIRRCTFDTASALEMNYRDADIIQRNRFLADHEAICEFSHPPLVIKGLPFIIARLDQHVLAGHLVIPQFADIKSHAIPGKLYSFLTQNRKLIESLRYEESPLLYGT